MTRTVWLNGALVGEHEARISPFDRGLLLGDGVFETMRAYGGAPAWLDEHMARLRAGCAAARLAFPEGIPAAVQAVLHANGLRDASVRVTVTRGPGGRGASPRGAGPQTVLVTAAPIETRSDAWERGLRVVTARRRRVAADALDPGVKAIQYLVNVLAKAEAEDEGADDALFLDAEGRVVEATQANVLLVKDGDLVTPPLSSGCLPGVTRAKLLGLAPQAGLRPIERDLHTADVLSAEEVLLSASILEVAPVVQLDGRPIGEGRPGPAARRLHALYRNAAAGQADPRIGPERS